MDTVKRVVVVGGGPGGYEAALVAAQLGADVTVVYTDGVGGSAVLTDCVPSKTLIATAELMADMEKIGGVKYAKIAALSYRQCFAAGKFVADTNGQPLQFSKENHSNGCIATSDVFYPMAPQPNGARVMQNGPAAP